MKQMKTILLIASLVSISSLSAETWEIRMILDVPRVAENTQSIGFRKYQTQKIRGLFTVDRRDDAEPDVVFCSMENLTHQVGGKNVTYDVVVDDVKWHGIGSNLTNEFPIRSCILSLTCNPSYAIGNDPTEDNSLIFTCSGKGRDDCVQGYVSGKVGCGCNEYGHVSPTRIWSTGVVVDTAAVYGRWKAKRVR